MMSKLKELLNLLRDSQHSRLLRLSYPHEDAPQSQLLVNRLTAKEYLSRDFEIIVELLSDDASLELEALMGKLLCVSLVQASGLLRPFTGYVSQFKLLSFS